MCQLVYNKSQNTTLHCIIKVRYKSTVYPRRGINTTPCCYNLGAIYLLKQTFSDRLTLIPPGRSIGRNSFRFEVKTHLWHWSHTRVKYGFSVFKYLKTNHESNGRQSRIWQSPEQGERAYYATFLNVLRVLWVYTSIFSFKYNLSWSSTLLHLDRKLLYLCFHQVDVLSASPGKVVCGLRVEEEHTNRGGTLHGGLTATLVDVISTMAIMYSERGSPGVSVDMNITWVQCTS